MTQAHPCSYLPDEQSTTVFVDPNADMDAQTYAALSDFGFRRSGSHLYRPRCANCSACIPLRIPVAYFSPTRAQKRCLKRNRDLHCSVVTAIDTDEHYALYQRYIEQRHADGDMFPPSRQQYKDFLSSEWGVTDFLEFRDNRQNLVAVAVSDRLNSALSAIYSFFDPNLEQRSLGRFAILYQIQRALHLKLDYVYLGYWIKNCQKMNYKTEYRPFQMLINSQWISVA